MKKRKIRVFVSLKIVVLCVGLFRLKFDTRAHWALNHNVWVF